MALARRLWLPLIGAITAGLAAPATTGAAPTEQPVLFVGGALPRSGALRLSDLQAMKPVEATWSVGDEKRTVLGVPLDRLLEKFGFTPGVMGPDVPTADKLKGWKQAVVASAPDGFRAVLSCAELIEAMGATRALVAWKIDGKPLPPGRGPLRLVVLTDKQASRSVHALNRLDVVEVVAPPASAAKDK